MEAYAIISIQTASPALDFQCLVFLTDELKTQLLRANQSPTPDVACNSTTHTWQD
ncbi:hypothetical protein EV680_13127 [Uruburuella suis]|uniref:Uncharacterized protein n=1 Tax=Uruburuella suis TaxID=252130 RepID=A0ABY2BXP4_9NEIS|nr:hypothetical protein EV680_13127 [Uruburuella suis]